MLASLPTLESMKASLCRDSLKDFVVEAWPCVQPFRELIWSPHMDVFCSVLEGVTAGDLMRVVFNVPPGTSKSMVISVLWPCWEWIKYPHYSYLTASYSEDNTIRDNRRSRALITSDWYRNSYGVELSDDQGEKRKFETTAGGWRIATSVGGRATGEHPNRIIIDDPLKAKDATSSIKLKECNDWHDGTISTRKSQDPAIIIVMQRLHENDLSGHVLSRPVASERYRWEHVLFPMRYEVPSETTNEDKTDVLERGYGAGRWDCPCHADGPDPRDHRTEPGELLCPDLLGEGQVQEMEGELGPYGASAQLQQRPTPETAGYFHRHYFEIVDAAPVQGVTYRGWDTGGGDVDSDRTAGVKMREHKGIIYILDAVAERTDNIDELIPAIAKVDGKDVSIREEKEGGSSGGAVVKKRSKDLSGYDYEWVVISGDKRVRARPFRAQCKAGNVRIVRGDWNEDYIREMCSFPVGRNDDFVDASSCCYNALVLDDRRSSTKLTW